MKEKNTNGRGDFPREVGSGAKKKLVTQDYRDIPSLEGRKIFEQL